MAGGAMAQGAARAGAAAGSGADDAGSGGRAQGITTGWNRLDSWSEDLAQTVNDNHDECVTNRFHLDNPVAAGVADAADEASSGDEGGSCPRLTSGWTTLDSWADDIANQVDSNHAECVSDSASGGSKCPTLDSGWKRLDKWAAKIAGVIDSNHDECIRLKPHQDQSDLEEKQPDQESDKCVEVLLSSGTFLVNEIPLLDAIYAVPSNGRLLRLVVSLSDPLAEVTITLLDNLDEILTNETVGGVDPNEFDLLSWPIESGEEIDLYYTFASEVVTVSYELYGCLL